MTKPTITFVHGGPGLDHSYFIEPFRGLGDAFNLRFYTQNPAYGEGTRYSKPMDALAAELSEQCSKGRAKTYLLGHSFGAAIVLETIRQFPQLPVIGLILVSWVYDREIQSFFENSDRKHLAISSLRLKSPNDYRKFMLEQLPFYFPNTNQDSGKKLLDQIDYNHQIFNDIWSKYRFDLDLKPTLSNLELPVLSISGAKDRVVSQKYIEIGEKLIGCCKKQSILRGGHFPFVDEPSKSCKVIYDFIQNCETNSL